MEPVIVSAPGKVILHGEHAVVYQRTALAASLNLRTYLKLAKSTNGKVSVNLPDIGIHKEWCVEQLATMSMKINITDLENPPPLSEDIFSQLSDIADIPVDTQNTKHLAIVAFLYLYCAISGKNNRAIQVTVQSKLPVSAGLGSSAAYSTCLSGALLVLENVVHDGHKWSKDEMNVINTWAFQAEKIIHGKPSGIDNTVSTYGRALKFSKIADMKMLDCIPQIEILLVNTKVPRSTKRMVAGVREKYNKYPSIMEKILDSVEEISKECQKVFEEISQNKAFGAEKYRILEDLIDLNQTQLIAMGVNHPALQKVCDITMAHGLHSKLTGAGGGGCAYALLSPDLEESAVNAVKEKIQNAGYTWWQTTVGGPGVTLHYGDDKTVPKFTACL